MGDGNGTDYYKVLEVPPNASQSEMRQAFRSKALRSHPDRGGSHAQMIALNEAWGILGDPERRARYDASRSWRSTPSAREAAQNDKEVVTAEVDRYPKAVDEFDAWVTAVSNDFKSAKYGQWGQFPTVRNSSSGCLFILGGVIAAFALLCVVMEHAGIAPRGSAFGHLGFFVIAAGAWAGKTLHSRIADSISSDTNEKSKRTSDASHSGEATEKRRSSPPRVIPCDSCGQQLRVPLGAHDDIRVRCGTCGMTNIYTVP